MSINEQFRFNNSGSGVPLALGVATVLALVALSAVAVLRGVTKPVIVGWVAFAAMAGAIPFGARAAERQQAKRLVWGYGLASGAMITSAAVFLLPQAFVLIAAKGGANPQVAGFGVAAGVLLGFGAHTVGHRFTHADLPIDHTGLELTAHSLTAGAIIGVVYGILPELSLVLGLAIVSHKGPAGYAAARRLRAADKSVAFLLVPAAGVGVTAVAAALLAVPNSSTVNAGLFGFAAGVFLHVAMDFLPSCELGGEVYEVANVSEHDHHLLDRLRLHAVASTVLGGIAVFGAWLLV